MSTSFVFLKTAVRQFINRPADEAIDYDELRDVVEMLEGELDQLDESPEERARSDTALAKAIKEIDAMMKRSPS